MYLTSNLQNKNDICITLPEISLIASSNIVKGNHKKITKVMPIKGIFILVFRSMTKLTIDKNVPYVNFYGAK